MGTNSKLTICIDSNTHLFKTAPLELMPGLFSLPLTCEKCESRKTIEEHGLLSKKVKSCFGYSLNNNYFLSSVVLMIMVGCGEDIIFESFCDVQITVK